MLFVATIRGFRDMTGGRKAPRPIPSLSEPAWNRVKATLRKMMNREIRPSGQQADKPLVLVPYVSGVTEKMVRAIKSCARVATRPEKNLNHCSETKG